MRGSAGWRASSLGWSPQQPPEKKIQFRPARGPASSTSTRTTKNKVSGSSLAHGGGCPVQRLVADEFVFDSGARADRLVNLYPVRRRVLVGIPRHGDAVSGDVLVGRFVDELVEDGGGGRSTSSHYLFESAAALQIRNGRLCGFARYQVSAPVVGEQRLLFFSHVDDRPDVSR